MSTNIEGSVSDSGRAQHTQDLLWSPGKQGCAPTQARSPGNRPQQHLGPKPRYLGRAPLGARGRGSAQAPRAPQGPAPAPPSPAPSRPSHGGARPLQAPLTAQAQSHAPSAAPGAVRPPRRSVAASAAGGPPLAVWGRALWGSVSAPERGQRPSWVPQVSAAAGRRGPGRGAPPPLGARLTRAGLGGGRGRCSCGRGGGRGARRSDPDARPGQRAPSPRHAGSGTPVSGGGGAGLWASGHPRDRRWTSGGGGSSPAPRARARYSLTARSRAPEAGSRELGYL